MDQALIQSKVQYGYGKAASFLGSMYSVYRPVSNSNPFSINSIETVQAAFDVDPSFSFRQPAKPGVSLYYALADFTLLEVGDYIVNNPTNVLAECYFFSGSEPIKPNSCIRCNRLVTITRPGDAGGMGFTPGTYSTANDTNGSLVIAGFPGSFQEDRKINAPVNLPQDPKLGGIKVLLPTLPQNILIRSSDIIQDDVGRRFTISSAEHSWTGWKLTAELTVT